MVGAPVSRECCMAASLGPKARLISAWGIVPGTVTQPSFSRAPTARFIAFDEYLLGGAISCSGNLARAFSPRFVFQFVTWGFAPGWFEDASLALTAFGRFRRPKLRIRTLSPPFLMKP